MKALRNFSFLVLLFIISACSEPLASEAQSPAAASREYYQLKIYTFATEAQQNSTDQYLKEAFLPALKKLNMGPVGVFKHRLSEEDSILRTYLLIPFPSLAEYQSLDSKLVADEAHQSAGAPYLNAAHDQAPYERIESNLLYAFEDMPQMSATRVEGPRSERVYELRSYESATEELYRLKVDMFNAGGEIALFADLDFKAVFYAEVLAGNKMPNLMYMTTFSNMESRDAHWKSFVESPRWETLKAMEKYQNTVSNADIMLLYPTEYSDY
ncbi:MAG: NIPSNAP family protein [Bacteroidota bacterium]